MPERPTGTSTSTCGCTSGSHVRPRREPCRIPRSNGDVTASCAWFRLRRQLLRVRDPAAGHLRRDRGAEIWPEANEIDRGSRPAEPQDQPSSGLPLFQEFESFVDGARFRGAWQSNLANVVTVMIGIRNSDKDTNPSASTMTVWRSAPRCGPTSSGCPNSMRKADGRPRPRCRPR